MDLADDARQSGVIATVALGFGALAAVAGSYLLLTAPSPSRPRGGALTPGGATFFCTF